MYAHIYKCIDIYWTISKRSKKMAQPISPTPVLRGEDKEQFLQDIENSSYSSKKERFLERCDDVFKAVKKELD